MKVFRRCVIATMDLLIIFFIARSYYTDDGTSDVFGLFVLFSIFFFIAFNLYAWLIYVFFRLVKQRHAVVEAGFLLLMLLPFYLLYHFTH